MQTTYYLIAVGNRPRLFLGLDDDGAPLWFTRDIHVVQWWDDQFSAAAFLVKHRDAISALLARQFGDTFHVEVKVIPLTCTY